MSSLSELELIKYELLGSFLKFTRTFYYLRTGRTFDLSNPPGRESHFVTIMRELVLIKRSQNTLKDLLINVAPRSGKTELLIHWIAWCIADDPTCNFLYTSYSKDLATKQTGTVKQIIEMRQFQALFPARINRDSRAKDAFETTQGGAIYAAGTGGTITGRGAGIKGAEYFGGAVVIDDSIKPDEASSDTIRERINEWADNTLGSRLNNPKTTPIIFIGQRTHEEDLPAKYRKSGTFKEIIIPSLDEHLNPIHPEMHTQEMLIKMRERMPYVFASQYQQDPLPAGGGLFQKEWFITHDIEPTMLKTFITLDTAETDKTYNDPTAMSFWGIYEIEHRGILTGEYGLHWINCIEEWIDAANLEDEYFNFHNECCHYPVKPSAVLIEKKSTGVTLLGVIKKLPGMRALGIERTKASTSKTARYIEMQPWISGNYVSLPTYAKHTPKVITHMGKITANNTHAHDDIADTCYDAVRGVYIAKNLLADLTKSSTSATLAHKTTLRQRQIEKLRNSHGMGRTG